MRAAAVRYASVGTGLVHGRGRKNLRTGRWERSRRPSARLLASDLALQDSCSNFIVSLVIGFRLGLGVLGTEGVGDPLVRGVSLPVDANIRREGPSAWRPTCWHTTSLQDRDLMPQHQDLHVLVPLARRKQP